MSGRPLLPHHAKLIEASAITPEVAAATGYWSSSTAEELEAIGFALYQCNVPALVVPIHDTTGALVSHQIRPDRPRLTEAGKELKYETPAGAALTLDVHPSTVTQLGDPRIPLIITEGARKRDSAISHGLLAVSLMGVSGWRGRNDSGGIVAHADWDRIALNGREVAVAFDSDLTSNNLVSMECERLLRFLRNRKARAQRILLLPGPNGEKTGLDDYFARGGTVADLAQLVDKQASGERKQKETRTDREVRQLVALVTGDVGVEALFHAEDSEPYITTVVNGVEQTLAIHGTAFGRLMAASFYKVNGVAPSREAVAQTRAVLEGRACFEATMREVSTRVATGPDGAIYLDLANDRWEVVRIDAAGWGVMARSPARFRRAAGMLPLPRPDRGGSLADLRKFLNVEDDASFVLIGGWLVAAMRPRGPFPIAVIQGEQGSAKSTSSRVFRRLIDPNKADLRSQPKDPHNLSIAANNGWIIGLDNLSGVPDWLSDGLCRLATGGGFATRTLYTDSDESIFDAQRPIILNGIDAIATRGDLLDRAILLNLPVLKKVRAEKKFWREFEAARPALLGALLDAVSAALRNENEVVITEQVRMMDAAIWVTAAEPALPWQAGEFIDAYASNRRDANALTLEASPVAEALLGLMESHTLWEGTASELLGAIDKLVAEKIRKLKTWPKTARGCSSALRRLAPNLRRAGIEVTFAEVGHEKKKIWTLCKGSGKDRPHSPHDPQLSLSEALGAGASAGANGSSPDACEPADSPHLSARKGNGKDDAGRAGARIPTSAEDGKAGDSGGWL